MYTNDDGTTTTDSGVTELTNYTIPTSVGGVYTVSVEAVDGVGNVGPSTTEVVRSSECLVLYPDPQSTAILTLNKMAADWGSLCITGECSLHTLYLIVLSQ